MCLKEGLRSWDLDYRIGRYMHIKLEDLGSDIMDRQFTNHILNKMASDSDLQ
jgi:hypothetical protein